MIATFTRTRSSPIFRIDRLVALAQLPSIPLTLALLSFVLPVAWITARPLGANIWWVLKNGQVLVERGSIGTSDPFTFASHNALDVNAQWLAQLVYYRVYVALGLEGVVAFTALVAGAAFALLFHISWRRTRSLGSTSAAMCVAVAVAVWQLDPRAQTLTFLPFAATYWLLSCAPRRGWLIASLAVAEALWANLHGSFFVGLMLTSLLLAGHAIQCARSAGWRAVLVSREARFLLLAFVAQALGTLATPNGLELYAYAWQLSTYSAVRDYVSEWAPTSVAQVGGLTFFASVAIWVVALSHSRRRVAFGDLVLLAVFCVMSLQAVRNVIWWALVLGPVLATTFANLDLPPQIAALGRKVGSGRHNVLRLAVVVLMLVTTSPWIKASNPLLPSEYRGVVPAGYPTGASEFLMSHNLGPRLYADQTWGSYLDWKVWPSYQVMVDSSIETHPIEVWRDVISIDQGHVTWQEKLDAYDVDVLLLNRGRQAPLVEAVERSSSWRAVYSDSLSIVFVRSTGFSA